MGRRPNVIQEETSKRNGFDLGECLVLQEYNFYTVIFSTTFLTPRKEDEI